MWLVGDLCFWDRNVVAKNNEMNFYHDDLMIELMDIPISSGE